MYYCIRNGFTYENECELQSCVDWAIWQIIRFHERSEYCEVDICDAKLAR